MIDLHCHIIPGIDDGAQSLDEALEMAREAVKDGISAIVATPHHRNGKYNNAASQVRQFTQELNKELVTQQIPLQVYAGQEIRITTHFIEDLFGSELLTLNDSSYMLIEFPSASVPERIEDVIYELRLKGIIPIIAHPERNAELTKNPLKLYELIEMGALSQITSHSINGAFGRKVQSLSLDFCRWHLAHIIASDAHNVSSRAFGLREAYDTIGRKLDSIHAKILMHNAQEIFEGKMPEVWDPIEPKKGWLRWAR